MTDKPIEPSEALEILKRAAVERAHQMSYYENLMPDCALLRTALAALEGVNVYFSRFKPTDSVWAISFFDDRWQLAYDDFVSWVVALGNDNNCFPTRAEAEAECEKRNKEGT